MMMERSLERHIADDLREKMVFLAGPRQVGKTTLCKQIGQTAYMHPSYMNWDAFEQHQMILKKEFPAGADLLIFDELHKYRLWKTYLKGLYDLHREKYHILVSGSARLDVYRRGGDSLLGRYHLYRMHPLSVAELLHNESEVAPFEPLEFPEVTEEAKLHLHGLLAFGGFPEPFLAKNDEVLRRAQRMRLERLIREDIRDLTAIREVSLVEQAVSLLPERAGSLFSLNALREDMEVAHETVARWMDALEDLFIHFRIRPFTRHLARSLKKEPKLYLWDWTLIEDDGRRLENLVAMHLLKFTHFLHDLHGYDASLHFLRDIDGKEVDFLVAVGRKPWFAVEVKQKDATPTHTLSSFRKRLGIPVAYHITGDSGTEDREHADAGVRVMSAAKFLGGLA